MKNPFFILYWFIFLCVLRRFVNIFQHHFFGGGGKNTPVRCCCGNAAIYSCHVGCTNYGIFSLCMMLETTVHLLSSRETHKKVVVDRIWPAGLEFDKCDTRWEITRFLVIISPNEVSRGPSGNLGNKQAWTRKDSTNPSPIWSLNAHVGFSSHECTLMEALWTWPSDKASDTHSAEHWPLLGPPLTVSIGIYSNDLI